MNWELEDTAQYRTLLGRLLDGPETGPWDIPALADEAAEDWRVADDDASWQLLRDLVESDRAAARTRLGQLLQDPAAGGPWLSALMTTVAATHGEPCLVLEWDSGGPGAGAGTDVVYRLGDQFLVTDPVTFGVNGPYDTFEAALTAWGLLRKDGRLIVSRAVTEIRCSVWTTEQLVARLEVESGTAASALSINGMEYAADGVGRIQHAAGEPDSGR